MQTPNSLIQLLRLLNNLLLILPTSLHRPILLYFITKIRRRNPHLHPLTEPELCIIKQLYRQINTLGAEKHNERIAFENALLVGVELYARFSTVDFFRNDAAAREDGAEFVGSRGGGKGDYVDGGVLALAGFGGGFGFFGLGAAACVLR